MKKITSFFIGFTLLNGFLSGQNPSPCGQDIATQQLYAKYPGLEAEAAANHARILEEGKRNLKNSRSTPPTYIIPVVFHIIHDYGTENITDAQVIDAVNILNEDFRLLNPDASQIVAPFDTLATDCEIEFRLAGLDPNGNCTNGIEHIASMETYVGDDGSKINQWPRDRYLNIWVVKNMTMGATGYAYFPSAVSAPQQAYLDGIVILSNYTGSIGTGQGALKHTLTHNVGHWLELAHLGGPPTCIDGDGISDTPVTMGWVICQLNNNDVCNPGIPENVQNFMEFSYCPRMYTPGQKTRMHNILNGSMCGRNNLWTNANLAATGVASTPVVCKPIADFQANRTMFCEGGNISFTDLSWNGPPASWQWIINGPATFTSTTQSPTFSNIVPAGWYDVTLIVASSAGADTLTKTNYLLVSTDTAMFDATYSESFTNPWVLPQWYVAKDRYGNGSIFSQSPNIGLNDSGGVWLNEYGNCVEGDIDELITPSFFLNYTTNLQFQFCYAYTVADPNNYSGQRLRLFSSNDCGQTWQARWNRLDSTLPTTGYMLTPFYPNSHLEWDTITVNIPSLSFQSNVRFKFEFSSPDDGGANNLFIDNINILLTNVGVNESESISSFTIYPNPGDGNATIAYAVPESGNVQLEILDISGRLITSVNKGEQAAGNYTLPLNENGSLAPGTYIIRMTMGDKVSTQKYVSASPE